MGAKREVAARAHYLRYNSPMTYVGNAAIRINGDPDIVICAISHQPQGKGTPLSAPRRRILARDGVRIKCLDAIKYRS